jgi:hypothetical protein
MGRNHAGVVGRDTGAASLPAATLSVCLAKNDIASAAHFQLTGERSVRLVAAFGLRDYGLHQALLALRRQLSARRLRLAPSEEK